MRGSDGDGDIVGATAATLYTPLAVMLAA